MRILLGLSLVLASSALGGCVSNTFSALSNLNNGCSVSAISVSCAQPTSSSSSSSSTSTTPTTPSPTVPATPTTNTGNNAGITTGDTTIALESNLNTTLVGATPAVSQLSNSALTLGGTNSTASQVITFNTNTADNSAWPIPKTMTYDPYGTCATNGSFTTAGTCNDASFGTGLGGNYKQYRYNPDGGFDEQLQVWSWKQSYATQYRDISASGTAPQHQAWSFGGNYTPATGVGGMPTSGKVDYAGKFTATAVSANWVDLAKAINPAKTTPSPLGGKDMPANNTWQVLGNSALHADFGAGTLNGTLVPKFWTGINGSQGFTTVDVDTAVTNYANCYNVTGICDPTNPNAAANFTNWQDYQGWMSSNILLSGTITSSPTNAAKPNQVTGTAVLDPTLGWFTSTRTNPMYAGFFGNGAKEVTGAFSLYGKSTAPNGGLQAINNNRSATLSMSGIFNGQ